MVHTVAVSIRAAVGGFHLVHTPEPMLSEVATIPAAGMGIRAVLQDDGQCVGGGLLHQPLC